MAKDEGSRRLPSTSMRTSCVDLLNNKEQALIFIVVRSNLYFMETGPRRNQRQIGNAIPPESFFPADLPSIKNSTRAPPLLNKPLFVSARRNTSRPTGVTVSSTATSASAPAGGRRAEKRRMRDIDVIRRS